MTAKAKLLYVTDLAYKANGRVYCDEDIFLSSRIREQFDLALCPPKSAAALMPHFDVVMLRNTGPIMYFQEQYATFRKVAGQAGAKVFNELTGKADMRGKQYLVDLHNQGYPVIPSIDVQHKLHRLPSTDRYVVKLKNGADSIGTQFVSKSELEVIDLAEKLIQPMMDFSYEVSFYFLNHEFQYSLYAPNPDQRWNLELYDATTEDLDFAKRFIDWNDIDFGIQRVDACRMPTGELFLMELEDINPFLSLQLVPPIIQNQFVEGLIEALKQLASKQTA